MYLIKFCEILCWGMTYSPLPHPTHNFPPDLLDVSMNIWYNSVDNYQTLLYNFFFIQCKFDVHCLNSYNLWWHDMRCHGKSLCCPLHSLNFGSYCSRIVHVKMCLSLQSANQWCLSVHPSVYHFHLYLSTCDQYLVYHFHLYFIYLWSIFVCPSIVLFMGAKWS